MKRVAILLSVLMALAPCVRAQGQTTVSSGQDESKKRIGTATQAQSTNDLPKQSSVKLEEGDRITLRNRFGPIIVTGGTGDTLEATVTELKKGTGDYKFHLISSRSALGKIMVTTAVMRPRSAMSEQESKAASAKDAAASARTTAPAKPAPTPKPGQPGTPPSQTQPGAPQVGGQGAGTARGTGAGTNRPRTPRPERPEASVPEPPDYLRGVGDIKLEVKLPRNAHIDLIDSRRYAVFTGGTPSYLTNTRNDVFVKNMETPISIISSGDVQTLNTAGLEVKTRAASVSVKDVLGPVHISTVTGTIIVKDASGDVRAVSITGSISIECAKGRTEASNTNGVITLMGIGGDLDATSTGGTITFTGAIRDGGRYRLKSMSGPVRMFIQREPPGFVTSLSSYKGQILVDFELKTELSANTATSDLPQTERQPVRRVIGRYGDGDARITLDSFSGAVQLTRAPNEVWKKCP